MLICSRNLLLILGLLASPVIAATANENVWSFVDDDGVSHFSNVPDASPYRLYLKDPGSYRLKSDRVADNSTHRMNTARTLPIDQNKLPFADMVTAAATEQKLDPALLHAIIHVESRHNTSAVSPKGAIGLMQVLPETARRMGVASISTPEGNINAGARYMRFLLNIFGNDVSLALAAYNAGENAVIRHGNQIPPYPETVAYVPAVIAAYD